MTIRHSLVNAPILALGLFSTTSAALDYEMSIGAALEHSNNALLTRDQQRSDTQQRVEADITLQENTRSIDATANYRIQHSDYKNNVVDDETVIEGQANIRWSPLPQTFNWDFFTSTRNLQRDRRQADILDNREKRTIISTGPVFNARLSSVDTLQVSGRHTSTKLEDSDQSDNDRLSGRIGWLHQLSATQELQVGFEYAETEFEQSSQDDIDNSSAYIGFTSELSSSQLRLKAGYNESKRGSSDDVSGPLLEAAIEYNPTNQQISLVAISQITDSTIGLGNNPTLIDDNISVNDSNFDNVDIVERLFSELRYSNESLCNVCVLSARLTYDEQDFDVQPRDETSLNIELGFQYTISSTLNISSYIARESIDFKDDDREDDIDSIRIRTNYSVTSLLTFYAELAYEQRDSSNSSFEYDETLGEIGMRYRIQ